MIQEIEKFVRSLSDEEPSAHDWWHTQRVRRLSLEIAKTEVCDIRKVEIIALLHDVWDWKVPNNQAKKRMALELLQKLGLKKEEIDEIVCAVEAVSFKGALVEDVPTTKEGEIVRDADRLDAMGAIGIARAFSYGGKAGRPIHTPEIPPKLHSSFEEYAHSSSSTVNHFYEKLLHLKQRMKTKRAKELAEARHEFMLKFLERFFLEWEGVA
ncbi:hypothetical protein B9Q13_03915 [Candidatus Marsarchaeota G2 archaeon ECH_B_SAG-G16]|uniref:HD domain-containing protein n=4 Tax=Candidatus Marsarchaeota TaxID=1978152 RepID=A0A2R6AF33_9ARCH|nr:MAG: hypothetical protein B9Q01_06875 [Candidatus Marsarchaeota G1 archaeon OSP_D]PSN84992.1 MAG: hypothetical protein B9Q02_08050 [Candidatus Marsarchaeota G1 archaeon BE_D]PSN87509.1 MAG: hypothetical protein B9Q00_08605 [Candidatus Marsarchaeota G1 archaeon OSP_C]PSO04680.1 MAG: hypothetical protein B9Q13_03915 [Candidatus Marsarchaeota G2 archaeon ECH_B_SAG-G16]